MKVTDHTTKREDLVWLAGVTEQGGAIDVHRGRFPRLRYSSTDRDTVGRIATLIGAKVRVSLKPAPYPASWHTELSGAKAAKVMRQLLPLLGARRSAEVAKALGAYELGTARARKVPAPAIHRPPATP